MDPGAWFAAQTALGLALVVASAKVHGRQIRLEREAQGHVDVDVRRSRNPAPVEDLWRHDRVAFWRRYLVLAAVALLYAGASAATGRGVPPSLAGAGPGAMIGLAAVAVGTLAFPVPFLLNALDSLRRTRRTPPVATPPAQRAWRQATGAPTATWWTIPLTLAAATGTLALL